MLHPRFTLPLISALLLANAAAAQTLSITAHTIAGGGGVSTGGSFSLTGTIGEYDAGPAPAGMSGGAFSALCGVWPGFNTCPADFNGSGATSVQDIFDFLAAYFANDPRADFNNSGTVSVQDIFDFLAAYFAGCP